MRWNDHRKLEGLHAFLGASKPQWMKYDKEQLITRYNNYYAADVGTAVHALAKDLINARIKLSQNDLNVMNRTVYRYVNKAYPNGYDQDAILSNLIPYVNDAIGYHMDPEVILYYSDNCFGTTDAIYYDEKKRVLRIHDLKTGSTPVHDEQLFIYDALFCLEYNVDPDKLTLIANRFYQNSEIREIIADPKEIKRIMNLIILDDKHINGYLKGMENDK